MSGRTVRKEYEGKVRKEGRKNYAGRKEEKEGRKEDEGKKELIPVSNDTDNIIFFITCY